MLSKTDFNYNPEIKVTAAQIGINKWDWVCLENDKEEEAKNLMREHKFDVIPIINEKGQFSQYFSTRVWNNYDGLNLNTIDESSTIYYNTGLRELIKKLNKEKRHYYFLTDYEEVVGLVSYANLSCQAVYNYLYFIISGIETGVSALLQIRIDSELIIAEFEQRQEPHYQTTLKRYREDNGEYPFYDYLDFKDLGLIINKFQNELKGKERALVSYYKKFESDYNELRKKVMHPVKTLLTTEKSIAQIDSLLDDYASIMEIISPTAE